MKKLASTHKFYQIFDVLILPNQQLFNAIPYPVYENNVILWHAHKLDLAKLYAK